MSKNYYPPFSLQHTEYGLNLDVNSPQGLLFITIEVVNIALGNTKYVHKVWIGIQYECQGMLL